MEMREFGGTGIRASVVGLGCNNFGIYQNATQAVAVVRKALDVGINFLDMAGQPWGGRERRLLPAERRPRAPGMANPSPAPTPPLPCPNGWNTRPNADRS